MAGAQQRVLSTFSRALAREAHILARSPELLWQQMYNRLQWEGEQMQQVLAPELAQRSKPGSVPWIHVKTPYRESQALVRTFVGHTAPVSGCAISPDGRLIASAGEDKTLRVWDAASGQALHILEYQNGGLLPCAFSPDGRLIASAQPDGTLRLWEASTGRMFFSLKGHVGAFAFSPDWNFAVSFYTDKTLEVWDAAAAFMPCCASQPPRILKGHTNFVMGCAFSPDGHFIVSTSDDKTLRVWDAGTALVAGCEIQPLLTLKGHTQRVSQGIFSPDGRNILSSGWDYTIRLWDAISGKELHRLAPQTNGSVCAFSPDGRFIVASSWGNTLRVWDAITGQPLFALEGHTGRVTACAFSPDGRYILSASVDQTLRLWDATKAQPLRGVEEDHREITASTFSPDGHSIFTLRRSEMALDSDLQEWDAATGKELKAPASPYSLEEAVKWHRENAKAFAFSPDRRFIVSTSSGNTLRVWQPATGQTRHILEGHTAPVNACAFSPDGRFILSASRDKTLRIWDSATGRSRHTLKGHRGSVEACVFSPDGRLFLSSSSDGVLGVWHAATGKTHALEGHTGTVNGCAFSPDGRFILSAGADETLRIWEVATVLAERGASQALYTLKGHHDEVTSCAFSPDGRFIFSTSRDRTLRVWNPENGSLRASLPLSGALISLGIHPFSPQMACGDTGGGLYRLALVGLTYAAILLTPAKAHSGLKVRCPACQQCFEVEKTRLGNIVTCPTPGCGLRLKLNPFTVQLQQEKKSWLSSLFKR